MNDPKQQRERPRPETNQKAANKPTDKVAERSRTDSDAEVEDSLEGEGSPGLTIMGGGGHA